MDLREPTAADGQRIAELVESAMTTSYRLSPDQIESIAREEFTEEAIEAKVESEGTIVRVAEVGGGADGSAADGSGDEGESDDDADTDAARPEMDEPVIAGYVEGRLREPSGELRWLFVDPEHRARGTGEELFDAAADALTEAGATDLRATTLEANAEGQDFFERFGLERVDDRRIEVGDETLQEYVFADPATAEGAGAGAESEAGTNDGSEVANESGTAADERTARSSDGKEAAEDRPQLPDDPSEMDLPDTETEDGTITATTDDERTLFLAFDEMESGTEAPFFATYEDEDLEERYGYYCSNCGSVDVTMDSVDRIECMECGNDHAPRSSDAYDGSYL